MCSSGESSIISPGSVEKSDYSADYTDDSSIISSHYSQWREIQVTTSFDESSNVTFVGVEESEFTFWVTAESAIVVG
jgi:hypothetical protein